MNERLKEILKQCQRPVMTADKRYLGDVVEHEKFAKLIIQDCIDIISPYIVRMENHDSGHPITDIKKHFGVK